MTPAFARWIPPEESPAGIESLAAALGLALPAARVLWRRGYREPAAARRFLQPSLDDLHDPFLMRDMDRAAQRLARAVRSKEPVFLYGDYDVDGATSVVILRAVLERLGAPVRFHVPDRFGEGYGMRPEIIERAAAEGARLVVSVDTGIRATSAVARAAELGIDVIVTDHHLPEAALPPAYAIVNPNRPDCAYPDKNLCGAGVTLKLIQALLLSLRHSPERAEALLASLLKLVSIATVADVVPLTGENRIIVRHGLDGLRSTTSPGLRALLDVAGFSDGQRPTAGQVAFRVAPRINAAGRMANAADVVELFLTDDESHARELAAMLHERNRDRQQQEAAILEAILAQCETDPVTDDRRALVFAGEGWHRGVLGIVAGRLAERFHRPVFVLAIDLAAGEAQGSGRSIPEFHLLEALESMSGLFTRFGGHRQAAGVTLPAARLDEFRRRLQDYAAARLAPEDLRPVREIDARLRFDELSDRTAADVLALEPFGCGNPAPVFLAENVLVEREPRVFKERHVRLCLRQGRRTVWMKAWNFAGRLAGLAPGSAADVLFQIEEDRYAAARGYPGWSLVLKDLREARS